MVEHGAASHPVSPVAAAARLKHSPAFGIHQTPLLLPMRPCPSLLASLWLLSSRVSILAPRRASRCRIRSSTTGCVVIRVRLSINLSARTIEQVVSKRRQLVVEMASNTLQELRDGLGKQVGCHKGSRCIATGAEPVEGILFEHRKTPGLDLCEAEYRKLPPEGDDEALAEVKPRPAARRCLSVVRLASHPPQPTHCGDLRSRPS